MMKLRNIVLLIGVIGCCAALPQSSGTDDFRQAYAECRRNSDCSPDKCCAYNTMTHVRFTTPSCKPLAEEGEFCRPGPPITLNRTLRFPDASGITMENVHDTFCPCARNLKCGIPDKVCRKSG